MMIPVRRGYHDYSHIFEWIRAGVVTYDDYARMVQDDLDTMTRQQTELLHEEDAHEAFFNVNVFHSSRADLMDTLIGSPFFERGESR